MVKSCAAYNCTKVEKCKPLNFPIFPLINEDLCKQRWVIATRSPLVFAEIISPKQITSFCLKTSEAVEHYKNFD